MLKILNFSQNWAILAYLSKGGGSPNLSEYAPLAYTQRKVEIMIGITDQKTCVDDTILFSDSIEQNFFKVCEFLTTGANGGCTFNPQKFQ